jgi:hypothetical protein
MYIYITTLLLVMKTWVLWGKDSLSYLPLTNIYFLLQWHRRWNCPNYMKFWRPREKRSNIWIVCWTNYPCKIKVKVRLSIRIICIIKVNVSLYLTANPIVNGKLYIAYKIFKMAAFLILFVVVTTSYFSLSAKFLQLHRWCNG